MFCFRNIGENVEKTHFHSYATPTGGRGLQGRSWPWRIRSPETWKPVLKTWSLQIWSKATSTPSGYSQEKVDKVHFNSFATPTDGRGLHGGVATPPTWSEGTLKVVSKIWSLQIPRSGYFHGWPNANVMPKKSQLNSVNMHFVPNVDIFIVLLYRF